MTNSKFVSFDMFKISNNTSNNHHKQIIIITVIINKNNKTDMRIDKVKQFLSEEKGLEEAWIETRRTLSLERKNFH